MKFSSIFIANLAEVARPLAHLMDKKRAKVEIAEDHDLCDRFIFADEDNRMLITPYPLDRDFLSHASRLLRLKNVINLSPDNIKESLCEAILADKKILQKIIGVIKQNPGIKIQSYAATDELIVLINFLTKKKLVFSTPEVAEAENLWIRKYFDSKSGFRQIASGMPEGYICHGINEIKNFVYYFLKKGKSCVVKTDEGLAGAGLKIVKKLPVFFAERYWQTKPSVVEEFIKPDEKVCGGAPNIEFMIKDKSLIPLYTCGMRVTAEGVFRGVEMGKGAVPKKISLQLLKYGKTFGKFLLQKGYRGFFEVDFVINKQGRLFPIEANLRRTGGTHVYELCRRILGGNFLNNYFIVAKNTTAAPRFKKNYSFNSLKKELAEFLYPQNEKKDGIVITIFHSLKRGNIGYVAFGKSKAEVLKLERNFLARLT